LVLGQSRSFVSSIANHCDDDSKIRYFPNWSEEVYDLGPTEFAEEVTREVGTFTILFAGNVGEAQDMPSILYAAEKLREYSNIRWLVIGDGRKFDWLKAEVEGRDLVDNVLLLGRYPIDRMPSFYKHADALLVSLKRDPVFSMTIPGKVQSYLAAGKPILGMLDGEGAAVISAANAGLVCAAGDSKGLAENALKLSMMNPVILSDMGSSGREYAQEEFSRISLLGKLDKYFAEALEIYADKKNRH
jgi:glycosyltransferase involved in cell wall biosynthesis